MTHYRIKATHPMTGKVRKLGPKFLSRDNANTWMHKFYPMRAFVVLACYDDENGKEHELKLSQTASR